jgi:hypothetical protein
MVTHRTLRTPCLTLRFPRLMIVGALGLAGVANGSFPSTEVFLPAVGRISGQGGAEFYTTVWATNLTGTPETFTFRFLKQGQANGSPASFSDTLSPGQTKVYENVVQTKLGLSSSLGAARITSTGEILVAERIYDQAPGADIGDTEGLFFAGVPKSFSIALGQSASIQGINQGGAENFRYNFALVETGGGSPTLNVQLFDGNGTQLGQKAYALQPYEQLQPNVAEVFAGISTTNARITATMTGGTGSVLLAGAQLANVSQDSSGFEMSFRDDLLGGGTAGVTSLNGLTGALTIAHGANTTVNVNGSTITIDAVSGSGTGLTAVAHDNSLTGSGTVATPLGVAVPLVVTSAGTVLEATTTGLGKDAISGTADAGVGIHGFTTTGFAVFGQSTSGFAVEADTTDGFGVHAVAHDGWAITAFNTSPANPAVTAENTGGAAGVSGSGNPGISGLGKSGADGVDGSSSSSGRSGVYGVNSVSGGYGVFGRSTNSGGIAVAGSGDNGGQAAHFYAGNVRIDNDLHVTGKIFAGIKDFEIDHPLDPAGKYLVHASIESSEMLNIYSGNVRLDAHGEAVVKLPSWMEAENADFRYQLTAIGGPARDLFVANEIAGGEFSIAGGIAGMKVSWQVTGVRKDAWAMANPLVVERPKNGTEKGFYLHPDLYGAPPEKQMNWADEPQQMKRLEAQKPTGSSR